MLDEIIKSLALQNCFTELENAEWFRLNNAFAQEPNELKRIAFIKALSAHSGVPVLQVQTAFSSLTEMTLSPDEQEQILTKLQKAQADATLKITTFQQRCIFKTMDLEKLSISRAQWNTLITRFEQRQKVHLTLNFFLTTLSSIQKIGFDDLSQKLNRTQPERQIKRKYQVTEASAKRVYRPYVEDNGINPFIFASTVENPNLEAKLEATGVRVGVSLSPATPEKGYTNLKRTPGKSKVRPVCEIDNQYVFFKPVTPYSKEPRKNRVDVRGASQEHITKTLPKLLFGRAEPVSYTSTRESILARSGLKRRQTQLSQMGASAADIFRAHGITIEPTESRSKHLAHLIAHFLADPQEIITADPEKEIINLVPSTAEANYNTLEAVELFMRNKLLNKDTDQIHIYVKPIYSGESLIPDTVVYSLNWTESNGNGASQECSEVFYINPQSHHRLTKSMHQSIDLLRETRHANSFSQEMQIDENSAPNTLLCL